MSPHPAWPSRASVVALVSLSILSGCSSPSRELVGPASQNLAAAEPALALAPPPLIERWKSPRISVWTDGWRRNQVQGGVSLEPGSINDFEIPEQQAVTFHWSARPKSAQGEILGSRWAVDLADILDETPRSGPDDVSQWSTWSLEETSASVGPFASGNHDLYVQARDNLGFVSMVTVRLRVVATSEELPLARR